MQLHVCVCGYLINKCIEKHSCDLCLKYAKHQDQLDQSFIFISLKVYQNTENSTYGNLNVADQLINYINELDDIFVSNFPTVAVENDV